MDEPDELLEAPVNDTIAAPEPPARILSQEERNDLRRKVLRREKLTLEEAQAVYATMRQGQAAATIAGEAKVKKGRARKEGISDEALDAALDEKLKGI